MFYFFFYSPMEEARIRQPSYDYVEEMKIRWRRSKESDATMFAPYNSYLSNILQSSEPIGESNPGFMMLTGETFDDFFKRHEHTEDEWMRQQISAQINACGIIVWRQVTQGRHRLNTG